MKSARTQERQDWWMNMAPSDWMSMTPSEWMDRTLAWWNQSYSNLMSNRPSDWWAMMYAPAMGRRESPTQEVEHRHHHHHDTCYSYEGDYEFRGEHPHRHTCRYCGSDPCECYCCIGDVDLAVYSHVGEQRVVQLVIENERHRDKEITLELSDWTTRGGKAAPVDTVLLEPKTFSLTSCAEQKVNLVVRIRGTEQPGTGEPKPQKPAGAAEKAKQEALPPDVDDCLIATADLRLVGCDQRPLRIAVAILPRDCDPYRVNCGCACC